MGTKTVTNIILAPDTTPVVGARVRIWIRPTGGFRKDTFSEVAPMVEVVSGASGDWSCALECNDNILPGNTYYVVNEEIPRVQGGSREWCILVTNNLSSPVRIFDILTEPLDPSEGGNYLTPAEADALFLTQAEADALYDPLGSSGGTTVTIAYVHTQAVPAAVWTITHGLSFTPNVIVVDSTGTQVEGDVQYSGSQVIITFAGAFSGVAYLS